MEKYSQFRDKGSGIAPFFPVPAASAGLYLPLHVLLFAIRLPILLFFIVAYFAVFCWLPIGSLGKKAALWLILAVPGIWWVDIQIDGVKKGTLSRHSPTSPLAPFPRPGSIIVSSLTSPLDAIYLAAVFDPVFTIAYPDSRLLRPCSLLTAILHPLSLSSLALSPPRTLRQSTAGADEPGARDRPTKGTLTTLAQLSAHHPDRIILLFPECTPSNGRAVLPLSPALLTAPPKARIFPTSLRYTPADITTPIPGLGYAWYFLWNLCRRPTHTVRVRIAEGMYNTPSASADAKAGAAAPPKTAVKNSYATNFLDSLDKGVFSGSDDASKRSPQTRVKRPGTPGAPGTKGIANGGGTDYDDDEEEDAGVVISDEERAVLDRVAEALARLGRVKRVGLGVREKSEFVRRWMRRRTR